MQNFFFAFSAKKLTKSCENFLFRMRIWIQEPLECVSRSEHWWMLPKIFAETIPVTKICVKTKIFAKMNILVKWNFAESKQIFAYFCFLRKWKKGFLFQPYFHAVLQSRSSSTVKYVDLIVAWKPSLNGSVVTIHIFNDTLQIASKFVYSFVCMKNSRRVAELYQMVGDVTRCS
jgi:hypothetical protein